MVVAHLSEMDTRACITDNGIRTQENRFRLCLRSAYLTHYVLGLLPILLHYHGLMAQVGLSICSVELFIVQEAVIMVFQV